MREATLFKRVAQAVEGLDSLVWGWLLEDEVPRYRRGEIDVRGLCDVAERWVERAEDARSTVAGGASSSRNAGDSLRPLDDVMRYERLREAAVNAYLVNRAAGEGKEPPAPWESVRVFVEEQHSAAITERRITLDVDASVGAETVREVYRIVQKPLAVVGGRRDEKMLVLFAFVEAQCVPGEAQPSWPELVRRWNATHPEWAYPGNSAYRTFQHAYQRTAKRLLHPRVPPSDAEQQRRNTPGAMPGTYRVRWIPAGRSTDWVPENERHLDANALHTNERDIKAPEWGEQYARETRRKREDGAWEDGEWVILRENPPRR